MRTQERADLAAHLHDSVLQTLALIQKNAADAPTVARLARSQERDLRAWLFDATPRRRHPGRGACARSSARSRTPTASTSSWSRVGDARSSTRPWRPIVAATREAIVQRRQARRHARRRHLRRGRRRDAGRGVRPRPRRRLRPAGGPRRPAGRPQQHPRPDGPPRRHRRDPLHARRPAPRCGWSCR